MTEGANTEQFESWNGDNGRRWTVDPDGRDRILAPVADALFAAAALRPGERVLDIGCGCGATTFTAGAQVGRGGAAVGADLSEPMLAVARRRATDRAAGNVAFVQADAQTHAFDGGPFDVLVSRFGTMFFADPAAAFANLASTVRPEGRLCIATWQPMAANDWITIPGAALIPFGSPPEAGAGPGMFAQSDPAVIASLLAGVGFDEIDIVPITVTLTLGADPLAAADFLAEAGPARAIVEAIAEADRPAALDALRAVLAEHTTPAGVQLDAAILVTTARRRS